LLLNTKRQVEAPCDAIGQLGADFSGPPFNVNAARQKALGSNGLELTQNQLSGIEFSSKCSDGANLRPFDAWSQAHFFPLEFTSRIADLTDLLRLEAADL
jgi:hypothetical protein